MLNHYFAALLTTSITHAVLSCFVYVRGRNRLVNITYALYSAAIAVWSGAEAFAITSDSYSRALLLWRLNHVGVIFIPIFFVHFVKSLYSRTDYVKNRMIIFLSYLIGIVFLCLNLAGILIREVEQKFDFNYFINSSDVYPLFFSLWVAWAIYGLICLFRLYFTSAPNKRNQLSYFSISMCIAYIGGIPNFIPTFNIEIPILMPFGTYAISIYAFFTVYAIVAYRLMDIEVIIKRTLVFTGIVAAAVSVIAFPFALIQAVIGQAFGVPHPFILMALGIATAVLIYRPLERVLINITDRYLFQKKYDYRELLRNASKGIALIQSLDRLGKLIVTFITMRARIKNAAVFIRSDDEAWFVMKAARGVQYGNEVMFISARDPLIEKLTVEEKPLRLADMSAENLTFENQQEIREHMARLKAEVIVPSFLGQGRVENGAPKRRVSLRNLLILGGKKSDEEYSEEDLSVFSTLAQESAIAIENARLYDAQIQKARELEETNQQLNDASTKLMRALSETEQAKKELETTQAQMLDMKRRELVARLAAALGHEIKNPLQGISFTYYHFGKLNKLLDEIRDYGRQIQDKKVVELSKKITEIANRNIFDPMRNYVDRIKGIANSVTDLIKGQDRTSDIHLGLIINYAIEEIRFTTYWERLTEPIIEVSMPRNLSLIRANAQRLQGVFVNLIKNAYDAMEGSSERRITIRAEEDPENSTFIRVYFEDTGCGMDEEALKRAFDFKFTTKGDKGTGIGLAYCKDTIEAHGGTICAESVPNKGTRFIFTLTKG